MQPKPFRLSPVAIALITVLGLLLTAVFSLFIAFNSIQKEMVAKENGLSAQYQDNQNQLSTYVVSIKESLGVADRSTDKLDRVLQDAVKGRYDHKNGAVNSDAMVSAVVEAYPDLKGVSNSYDKVQDAVLSGRSAYMNKQSKLLDMLRDYDTWRNSGLIHSQFTRMMGAPSNNLTARIGDQTYRGQDALDRMYHIVLVKEARESYETGELKPLDINPTPTN